MRFISKRARYVADVKLDDGTVVHEYRCPNKKCSMHVSEEYICCPYCGQKVKFREPDKQIKCNVLNWRLF